MKHMFLIHLAALCALWSCGGTQPAGPSEILISRSSIEADVTGSSVSLTITAPADPSITGVPEWITLSEGSFKDFKKVVTITVSSNQTYDKRNASLVIAAKGAGSVTLPVSQPGKAVIKDPVLPENGAVAMAGALGLGWNMGNHFDAFYNYPGSNFLMPSETAWGGIPATQATFNGVKAAGFKTVRIPVTWLAKIGPAPTYTIDQAWLDRVYEVVEYAHAAGLYVIVNTHHDENHHTIKDNNGADIDTRWQDIKAAAADASVNAAIKEEIAAVWKQIANRFADCGNWLIFEGFNEINDGGWGWSEEFRANPSKQCNILNEWNKAFVDAVRSTGGNNATRWLGVPTYAANPQYIDYFSLPSDPAGKLMISVHYYDPDGFTLGKEQYSDWGHTGSAAKKANWGDEDHVKEVFSKLYNGYISKNIPVYIGEFGASMRSKADSRAWAFYLYYLEYIVKAAKVYGLPCILWDNGTSGYGQEKHGYINHGNGSYVGNSKIAVDTMVKACYTDDESYTLQSVYDSAPVF